MSKVMENLLTKYALLNVFDVAVRDIDTKKILLYSENNTSTSLTGSSDNLEIRNGAGNGLWSKIYYNKSIKAEVSSNVTDLSTIAMLSGTTVSNDVAGTTYCKKQTITCTTDGSIELEYKPKDENTVVQIFKDGVPVTATISNTTVSIEGAKVNDVYIVLPYEIEFEAGGYEVIDIKADEFPTSAELAFFGALQNDKNQVVYELTIVLPKATPSTDFELATTSEMSPAETKITFDALSENGSLAKIYAKNVLTGEIVSDETEEFEYVATGEVTNISVSGIVYSADTDKFTGIPKGTTTFTFKDGSDDKTATKVDSTWSVA